MRRTIIALVVLATPAVAVVAAPVVTVSSEAPASVANARPGGEQDWERGCRKGLVYKHGLCVAPPSSGGPGKRAI